MYKLLLACLFTISSAAFAQTTGQGATIIDTFNSGMCPQLIAQLKTSDALFWRSSVTFDDISHYRIKYLNSLAISRFSTEKNVSTNVANHIFYAFKIQRSSEEEKLYTKFSLQLVASQEQRSTPKFVLVAAVDPFRVQAAVSPKIYPLNIDTFEWVCSK